LRFAFDMSERRACKIIGCVRMTVGIVRVGRTMRASELGCALWRTSAGVSAIGVCTFCYDGRASR